MDGSVPLEHGVEERLRSMMVPWFKPVTEAAAWIETSFPAG